MSDRAPGILARGPWAPEDVSVRWDDAPYAASPEADAAADATLAELAERGSPTHDGMAARMAGLDVGAGGVDLVCQPMRWSLRLGEDAADSLSALCVVRDGDGRWLAGRRAAWVASWPGRWALGAGGSVEVGENPVDTLPRELHEEWSLVPDRLTVEALIRIPSGMVMLVGLARVADASGLVMDPEHDEHAWWPPDPGDWPDEADPPLRLMATLLAGG
ncbi:MAG TPA: NUDIX hydrolase [Thermoleophilaceae bacterium]|nr:NUDIX hydrolase [Thermoleophilaceae bacterium]